LTDTSLYIYIRVKHFGMANIKFHINYFAKSQFISDSQTRLIHQIISLYEKLKVVRRAVPFQVRKTYRKKRGMHYSFLNLSAGGKWSTLRPGGVNPRKERRSRSGSFGEE